MARVTMLALLASVAACAGSSRGRPAEPAAEPEPAEAADAGPGEAPVDEARQVSELSAEENARVCEWLDRIAGDPRTIECGEGHTVRLGEGRCPPPEAWAGCALTVGESAACLRSILADPCGSGFFATPECASMGACVRARLEAASTASAADGGAEQPPVGDGGPAPGAAP